MPRTTWFCVDIECSGPVPELYDMLSVGVVVVHQDGTTLRSGAGLYLEIAPSAPRVDPGAMKVNGLSIDRLSREGLSLHAAMVRLAGFVGEEKHKGSQAVFVGHNAPFDWSFINHAFVKCGVENPFGYKALDTKALASGVLGLHWLDTNKETLQVVLGLPEQDTTQVHRADYDADYQAQILIGLLERMPQTGVATGSKG